MEPSLAWLVAARVLQKMTVFFRDVMQNSGDKSMAANHNDFSMKGTRKGATMHYTMHPGVSDIALITRGGWSCESVCKVFSYITGDIALVSIAGKALSEYANPVEKVHSMSLVFLDSKNRLFDPSNAKKVEHMIVKLFSVCEEINPEAIVKLFRVCEENNPEAFRINFFPYTK
jgi:hypothetical protein